MTIRTRRAIFYSLCVLFFALGGLVVLYAQGWRLDAKTLRPEKVGAIYIRSFPKDARISLDGKAEQNRAGLLSQGTLLSDLFPRSYDVTLTADGFKEWREAAAVHPSLVTEFKYAVLVPKTPSAVGTTSVKNFFVIGNETVAQTAQDAIVWRGKTIAHGKIADISTNLQGMIVKGKSYSWYDFSKQSLTDLTPMLATQSMDPSSLSAIAIDPYDSGKIIAESAKRILMIDVARGIARTIGRAGTGATLMSPPVASASSIAWTQFANASGTAVVMYDRFSQTTTISAAAIPGSTVQSAWIKDGRLGTLQKDGSLYMYDPGANAFQKLADDVRFFEPAPDGSAVAAFENRSLEIFPFTDALTYLRLNLPEVRVADRAAWYRDMNHLFVIYPDHAAFLDLDDLALKNLMTVAQGTNPLYRPDENIFYLINPASKIERFDFPR